MRAVTKIASAEGSGRPRAKVDARCQQEEEKDEEECAYAQGDSYRGQHQEEKGNSLTAKHALMTENEREVYGSLALTPCCPYLLLPFQSPPAKNISSSTSSSSLPQYDVQGWFSV